VDKARLALYHRWHAFRESARDWAPAALDRDTYFLSFAFPHPSAREIAYYDESAEGGPKLVGVGLCDETKSAWSAVYFYYDPDYAGLSPGVANVVFQIELARSLGLSHLYLGYYVAGSRSMGYKARFQPNERLLGWPEPHEEPRWTAGP
jgi:arginine-tRNA-protein transferase